MRKRDSSLGVLLTLALLAAVHAQDAKAPDAKTPDTRTPDVLAHEIEALRAVRPSWREIAWRSCLLDGVREAREKKRPLLLWIFIDRPVDDARC